MSDRPIIGITKPNNKDYLSYLAIKLAVIMAGGKPLKITSKDKQYESANINGLILGGGSDIFPARYNQAPKEDYIYDQDRDEMEVFWAERARDENIPTLGICRGAQLLNIVCGGSLHMDVSQVYEGANYPDGFIYNAFFRKTISINSDSFLHTIIPKIEIKVNSIHKQAIDKLGNDMSVNAVEKNGVIQAICLNNHDYFLGVQFHPEFLIYKKDFRKIFKRLVQSASNSVQN